uniref:exo-alpha-sialidase n=1 Tax=Streptomyces sp. NBC_00093 TaxID=2975649 RepID=A0AAU2A8J1_9ACTN
MICYVRRRTLITALMALAASLVAIPPAEASGARISTDRIVGDQQVLFRSGTAGYGCFRIPTLIRTKAGTLLAFAEGRSSPSCADRGPIDIVVRRSTNDGRTWGPVKVALAGTATDPDAPYTRDNASPVADEVTGDVFLVSTGEPASRGTRIPYVQKSTDDGLTFGAPSAVTRLSGRTSGWFATGPAHGIQLKNGPYAGRLVVGAYESPNSTTQLAGVLYSADHGETWQASATENSYVAGESKPTETSVAELTNGDVYLATRNEQDDTKPHRTHVISTDGGTTVGVHTVAGVTTPQIQASVLALSHTYQSTPGDTLILAAPLGPGRANLGIRYSTNRGATWTDAPSGRINADRAGYSDLAELTGGEIGLVYEGGQDFSAANIYFNRLAPTAIGLPGTFDGTVLPQKSRDAGPTTPDTTPDANDAYLSGSPAGVSGRFRQALDFPSPGGYADIPYSPTVDPGSGDVTYSLFFKHTATSTTAQRALLWAYGYNAAKPQLWIRAVPSTNQIVAWAEGSGGRVSVTLQAPDGSAAYGDNTWHHLTLVRSGDQVSLAVDGTTVTRTGVTGSLTSPRASGVDGIRLGAKPDAGASDVFTGALDEFRMYDTALTEAQLTELRTQNTATGAVDTLAAHLPFQTVDTATDPDPLTTVAIEDDISGNCADGTLLLATDATPRVTDEYRMGASALPVATDRPGVEVPYVPAVDPGTGDFTYALWFRYSATPTTPAAALLWAYGTASGQPSLWIRARPGDDGLYAWAETNEGRANFAIPDPDDTRTAFGDNQWHLLTATRAGSTFTVEVDGTHTTQATGLTGSFTEGRTTVPGLRIGSRPGTTEILTGTLDDLRLYHRALTDNETDKIAASGSGTSAYPTDSKVWWPMENGTTQAHEIARPTTGPATPDTTTHCNNAYVRGTPALVSGAFGGGITLDGTDDAVELPYSDSESLGAGDFTLATWVRYDATTATGTPVLAWAYGQGATERQLWLRAEPANGRLAALIQTEAASTTAYAPDTAFRSGIAWHHVVLQREGTQLTLSIDGVTGTTGTVPAGSLTYGDAFTVTGVHLGGRPDGASTYRFKGSLDEFRLVRRALTTTELTTLREQNTDPTDRSTTARLSFEKVTTQGYARM